MEEYVRKSKLHEIVDYYLKTSNGAEHYGYKIIKGEIATMPAEDVAKDEVIKFANYLKTHACSYDLDNYHSFDAIDIEDLDGLVEYFLDKKEYC